MLYWNEIINELAKYLQNTKECLEKNFRLSSTLLRKLCVHYANGFDIT
jgi:hypothetical protein